MWVLWSNFPLLGSELFVITEFLLWQATSLLNRKEVN